MTDNGACFLSHKFQTYLKSRFYHVRIQYQTPQQLGLLEHFHGTLKWEEIYWRYYDNPQEARTGLESFRYRYNYQRPHWALRATANTDPWTPAEVYEHDYPIIIPKWQGWARAAKNYLDEEHQNDIKTRAIA